MALIGDDCFYFYNAGCHRGIQCLYRHQPAAKNTTEACPDWIKGSCLNKLCTLRHAVIDSRVTNSRIMNSVRCRYEASPEGCLNANCSYTHTKVQNIPPTDITTQVSVPDVLATTASTAAIITQPKREVVQTQALQPLTNNNQPIINGFQPSVFGLRKPVPAPDPPRVQLPQMVPSARLPMAMLPPQLAPLHALQPVIQPPLQMIPQLPQPPHVSILGAPPANAFPKNEYFSEQVRLFKQMLVARQQGASNHRSYSDDEEGYSSGKYKNKERQKSKKSKRNSKEGHKSTKGKHKKDGLSKGDEEILYGDYKDVKIEKKHKKKSDRRADSDSEVNVKSYEEVLREKALRKLMEKRKEKFNEEFEDLIQEEEKVKTKKTRKHSKSENDDIKQDSINNSKSSKKKRKQSSDTPENEVFSQEDAVELGLDASPIREELDEPEHDISSDNIDNSKIDNSKVPEEEKEMVSSRKESEADSSAVLIIPDETTDLTFGVDDNDDLALELNQVEEQKPKRKSKPKPVSHKSKTVPTKSKTASIKPKTISSKAKVFSSVVSVVKKSKSPKSTSPSPKTNLDEISSSSKRKVIKLTADDSISKDRTVKSPLLKTENKELVKITSLPKDVANVITSPKKSSDLKIKTFTEIMAEKRKRRFGNNEILVISDDNDSQVRASKKRTSDDTLPGTAIDSKDDVIPVKRTKIKRLSSSEEEKAKRRSIQLYKPPTKPDIPIEINSPPESKTAIIPTAVSLAAKKIVRIQKASLSTDVVDNDGSNLKPSTEEVKKGSGVMSFEEIMRAKRLRRQQKGTKLELKQEPAPIRNNFIKRKPVLKRPVLSTTPLQSVVPIQKNTPANQTKVDIDIPVNQTKVSKAIPANQTTSHHLSIARVSPLHVVPTKKRIRSESLTEEQLLDVSEPSTPNESISDSIFTRKSTSPGVVPRLSTSPVIEKPPKIPKLSSTSSAVVPEVQTVGVSVKEDKENPPSPVLEPLSSYSPQSMEDIQEALDEQKRKREKELLSDDEFEKEINDLSSGDDDDEDYEDIDADDLLMELEQMIDS